MENPDLEWRADVPVSTRFDDPYFSLDDGLAETRHVFLAGNGLPEAFFDGCGIGELGFGTGLNFCAALQAWGTRAGSFRFTSFERWPMRREDMARALAHWPEVERETALLLDAWTGAGEMRVGPATLDLRCGDVTDTLDAWDGRADFWFLDGFSPARNPEMWSAEIMRSVAEKTAQNGRFATYTAAGHVRRALGDAGFSVTRLAGYGRKRHMSVGRLHGAHTQG